MQLLLSTLFLLSLGAAQKNRRQNAVWDYRVEGNHNPKNVLIQEEPAYATTPQTQDKDNMKYRIKSKLN